MKYTFLSLLSRTAAFLFLFTLILGIGYPFLMRTIGMTFFPEQASGSLIKNQSGKVIGSSLIGQSFKQDKYFHSRLSFAGPLGYDGADSGASFLAPTSEKFVDIVSSTCLDYRTTNHIDPLTPIPADAATSSASGLDPHIYLMNARLQAPRIAAVRNIPLDKILTLINNEAEHTFFHHLPYINVLKANLALDNMQKVEDK